MKEFIKRVVHRFFALVFFVIYFPVLIFSQDTTDGIVWEPPIQLTDSTYSAYMPKIALSGDDTIHVTWKEDNAKHRLPYARSINGVWEPIRDLIYDTLQFPRRFNENIITAERNNIYIFSNGESEMEKNVMSKSADGGTTWITARIGTDSASGLLSANVHQDTVLFVYHPDNGYSYTPPFLMVSIDAGETWEKRPDTLDGWTRTALTPGTLHLVRDVFTNGAQEKLYMRSFDLGNSWEKSETLSTVDGYFAHEHAIASYNGGLDSSRIMMAWRDAKYGCFGAYGLGCSILERESKTNGNLWLAEQTLTPQPRGLNPAIDIRDSSSVIVWYYDVGSSIFHLYAIVRHGNSISWHQPIDITPTAFQTGATSFPSVSVSKNSIHVIWEEQVGGNGGNFCIFYRRGVFLTTNVKDEENNIPSEYSLSQNYPNPFNPTTRIKYKVQSTEYVSIKVYDVFGREVETLVKEKKQPGEYEIEWNPSASFGSAQDGGSGHVLSSGVYFIRMNVETHSFGTGAYFSTIKAILMK